MLPVPRPRFRPLVVRPPRPHELGQTFDEMLGFHPLLGDFLRLAAHGGTAFLGIYLGATQKGFIKWLGWSVGILHGLGALMDLLSIADTVARGAGQKPAPAVETQAPGAPPPPSNGFPIAGIVEELM